MSAHSGIRIKPVEVAESNPPSLARRKLSRRRLDGIATVFELSGQHFGRMRTLMRIDYSDGGMSGLADSVITRGTPVTIGFQTPGCIAHLGQVITCIRSEDGYRVSIAFNPASNAKVLF
jgi:hypothetical protein